MFPRLFMGVGSGFFATFARFMRVLCPILNGAKVMFHEGFVS